jgi:hypothetical protein
MGRYIAPPLRPEAGIITAHTWEYSSVPGGKYYPNCQNKLLLFGHSNRVAECDTGLLLTASFALLAYCTMYSLIIIERNTLHARQIGG